MSTIRALHPRDPDAATALVASFQPHQVKRKALLHDLPSILETALQLLLIDIDASPGQTASGAVGCRIIAACVRQLTD